ncbi:MAG: hypothetical protein AB7E05_10525 [Sphingobium sp.]
MKIIAETLMDRARLLAADIRARGIEIDSASKLPDDIVRQFIDLDLVSVLTPRKFGGSELGLEVACDIVRLIAAEDLGAAWVLAFYIGHNWIHCQFPEEAQREIYANGPSPCTAGVLAPTLKLRAVEGGYRISGRNGWNSGAPHAQWIMGTGMVVEGDAPKGPPISFIVPVGDVELVDTWDMQGMRASGSWDVVYDDVFIPAHRTVSTVGLMSGDTPGAALHANPFYRRPLTLVTFTYSLAPFVGALRGVVDEFVGTTRVRVGTNDGKAVNQKPTAHMRAGRGESNFLMAQTLFAEMTRIAAAPESSTMSIEGRIEYKARSAGLVAFIKDAVNDLVVGSGANAFRTENRMQRAFRNVNMISVHAFFDNDASMEGYGRLLLGLEPNVAV